MINRTEIKINLDNLDNIVKLDCGRIECANNLVMDGGAFHCNLKYVTIDHNGVCSRFGERRSNESL